MSQPLNAMELVQSWQIGQAKQAQMQQEMAINAMLAPYRAESLQSNAMRDRAMIDYQRNALAFQQQRASEANALAREGLGVKERIAQNMLAARQNAMMGRRQQQRVINTDNGPMLLDENGQARPVTGADGQPIPGKRIEKALPNNAIKELASAGASVEDTQRLSGSFQNEFGGHYVLGDFANTYKRVMGDETGQAQWWQDMDALQNRTRHELFGSALTSTELAAWNKTSINPRMNADQIRQNLTRRAEIEARAASKLARAYQAGGYNKDQIRELLGNGAQYLESAAPAASSVTGASETRTLGGKKYQKVNGKWFEL